MFSYPTISTQTELGLRWYLTPAGALPSITTVLSVSQPAEKMASLEAWRNSLGHEQAAEKTKEATDHGTMVHLLVERFLKNEELMAPTPEGTISPMDVLAFNSLKIDLKSITEIWGQEQALYSTELEIAGRFDCIGCYKGVSSVIDIKTAGRIKSEADIEDYKLQLAFYAHAHNELFGTDIDQGVILMAANRGFPERWVIKLSPHIEALKQRSTIFWQKVLAQV